MLSFKSTPPPNIEARPVFDAPTDTPATDAELYVPEGVAVDASGNIFIADNGNRLIREVNPSGTIFTYAGFSTSFVSLASLAVDFADNVYAVDQGACVVWKITSLGVATVVAGVSFSCGYNGDNIQATTAWLNSPFGLAVDAAGRIYIGDDLNNRVRMVDHNGTITTIAGTGTCGFSGDGGEATLAEVCCPEGLAVDSLFNIYFADSLNYRVREISASVINTVAGTGLNGYNGNNLPALSTNLDFPMAVGVKAVGVDRAGIPYLVDGLTMLVRKIH